MMSKTESISELNDMVSSFCAERGWGERHNLKDLSIALALEASELLELFRWMNDTDVAAYSKNVTNRETIEDECADILFVLLRIAEIMGISLRDALEHKLAKNALKYPKVHALKTGS